MPTYHPYTVTDFTYYKKVVPWDSEKRMYDYDNAYTASGKFSSPTITEGELDVEAFIVDKREYGNE